MDRGADPKRKTFRDWSAGEIKTFVDEHFQHRTSNCPVCHFQVGVHAIPQSDMTVLYFTCQRCGNGHEERVPQTVELGQRSGGLAYKP